jgi:hypothetical protein
MENRIEIPRHLVKKAHAHAAGAIRELERQLSITNTESKKNKLKARINRWNKVLEETDLLLNGAHERSADSARPSSAAESSDRRDSADGERNLSELQSGN